MILNLAESWELSVHCLLYAYMYIQRREIIKKYKKMTTEVETQIKNIIII